MEDNKLVRQFSAALRVSTPLIGIETPDQSATINLITQNINGDRPYLMFDLSGGLAGLNEEGKAESEEMAKQAGVQDPSQLVNASETLALALRLQPRSVLFVLNSPYLFDNPVAVQAIANLRDQFKSNKRCLVLLGGIIKLPQEIQNDVVVFEEEYPTAAELEEILLFVYRPAAEKYGWRALDGKALENAIDGEGGALFIATCNKIDTLPPEVIARFTLGLWEFDKPDKQAREGIWLSHLEKYDLNYGLGDLPDDEGWVGRDIRNCCELAWRMGVSPKQSARFVGIGGKPLKASRSTATAP